MKIFVLLSILSLAVACKTAAPSDPAPTSPPSGGPAATRSAPVDGLVETAERWIADGKRNENVAAVIDQMQSPVVERVVRRAEGSWIVVVANAESSDGEAVLLTVNETDSGWEVVDQEIENADYLWPSP